MIKSIAFSIKTSGNSVEEVHATLTQLGSKVLLEPNIEAVKYLIGNSGATQPGANIIRNDWRANQQIAISSSVKDDGMFANFDLNFIIDNRYFPFEGTGAVSSWMLDIPPDNNPDLSGSDNLLRIDDVIIHLKYTAKVAGGTFKKEVQQALQE